MKYVTCQQKLQNKNGLAVCRLTFCSGSSAAAAAAAASSTGSSGSSGPAWRLVRQRWALPRPCAWRRHMWCVAAAAAAVGVAAALAAVGVPHAAYGAWARRYSGDSPTAPACGGGMCGCVGMACVWGGVGGVRKNSVWACHAHTRHTPGTHQAHTRHAGQAHIMHVACTHHAHTGHAHTMLMAHMGAPHTPATTK